MEGASGTVEFLSVECDMIFAPDCELETEILVESQEEERLEEQEEAAPPPCQPPSPSPEMPHSLPSINELFKGRDVGVYRRTEPQNHFVLIFDPTLQPPVGKGQQDRGKGNGEDRQQRRRQVWRCSLCLKQFRSRGCLVTHGLTHIQPSPGPPPPCPVCSTTLPSRAALQIHVRRHFSTQTYQCRACHQRHLTRAQLVAHQQFHDAHRHHHPVNPSPAPTSFKGQGQQQQQGVNPQHYTKPVPSKNTSHKPQPNLRCDRCNITFATRDALWAHRKAHRERRRRRRRRHECPECGSQFWRSSALKKHRRAEHDV